MIVIAPAFFCAPGALLLGRLCGRNTITWLHIQDFELDAAFELGLLKGRILRSLAEIMERFILRGFVRVSSISRAMVNLAKVKGVESSRSVLLPNWVDLNNIQPQDASARLSNLYRLKLGISADQLVLMYSGSMNKKQGLELLVESIEHLSDLPQLVWLFAGEGPSKTAFVRSTARFSNVIHLPLQPAEQMNDWLNAADIHLLPQKAGAADLVLPSKLLGMLASGRPVVATSSAGSELFDLVSMAGACTEPGDSKAFSRAIRLLVGDVDRRLLTSKMARKLSEECFGQSTVLARFEHQLIDLVEH